MNLRNRQANLQIENYILSSLEKIKVEPGICRFNFRCSYNAVHDAIESKHDKIAMVFYIQEDHPTIHFINIHKGKFIDNTLGHWNSQYEYYLIRYINKDQFFEVNDIFTSYREELQLKLTFWNRIFSDETF